jgi:beta-lactamase regulating signal transducer with metallopeptidase domain
MMTTLVFDALRAALLLGFAWFVLRLTRGRSASIRRLVLVAALYGALLTPLLSLALGQTPVAGLGEIALNVSGVPMLDLAPDTDLRPASLAKAPPPSPGIAISGDRLVRSWPPALPLLCALLWLCGALAVGARLFKAHREVRRLLGAACPAGATFERVIVRCERAIGARARVMTCDRIGVPLTTGVLRPVVLLPAEAAAWTDHRWAVVLRHELAHVRQRDALSQLVAELLCAVYWFNPLAWWARRQLEIERELAADEHVVQSGLLASTYAAELLRVAAEQNGVTTAPLVALEATRRNGLSERVERLVTRGVHRLPSRWRVYMVLAAGAALPLLLACTSLARQRQTAPPVSVAAAAPSHSSHNRSAAQLADGSGPEALRAEVAEALGTDAARVELTIEPRIQQIAREETAREIQRSGARTATVIVLEPATGNVVALTNPSTATANYAPGSTLKTLTVAAALDEDKLSVDQSFDCGHGFRQYDDGRRLRDAGSHGVLSVSQIIVRSSNVGASRIYDLIGGKSFARWLSRFHLDEKLPVQLRNPAAGSAFGVEEEPAGSMRGAVAAMGHAVATSPLHMAALYAAVANDGVYVTPTLVRQTRDSGGNVAWQHEPKPERLLRSETARAVLRMLVDVVEDESGTGRAARLEGVTVAGKTGSAQVKPIGPGVGEGDSPSYVSFIGIVPASAPRYVVLVGVESAMPEASGGKIAAPAFARIAQRILAAR